MHTRVTYRLILAIGALTKSRYILTYIGDNTVDVHSQLGLEMD